MKAIASAVVVVALLSGCTTYRGSRKTAKIGGVAILVGAAGILVGAGIAEGADWEETNDHPNQEIAGAVVAMLAAWFLVVPGAVLGISGLIGMRAYDKPVHAQEATRQFNPTPIHSAPAPPVAVPPSAAPITGQPDAHPVPSLTPLEEAPPPNTVQPHLIRW